MGTENPTHFPSLEGGDDLINFGGSLVSQDTVSPYFCHVVLLVSKQQSWSLAVLPPNSHPLLD